MKIIFEVKMANNTTLEFDERADEWWSGLEQIE